LQKTTNQAQLYNPGYRATQDLDHMNHHMFIQSIKGMQVTVTSPSATLLTHNSIR